MAKNQETENQNKMDKDMTKNTSGDESINNVPLFRKKRIIIPKKQSFRLKMIFIFSTWPIIIFSHFCIPDSSILWNLLDLSPCAACRQEDETSKITTSNNTAISEIMHHGYKIDTSLHSIYNPVEITDLSSAQPTVEYVAF